MSKTQPQPDASSRRDGASRTSSSRLKADPFLAKVSATIGAHRMIGPREVVLVAISGGPDSTALLHALVKLRRGLECRLQACHVHHGLRGAEADADARQARALARSLRVPFADRKGDVAAVAREQKMSVEAAARLVRYELLEEAADAARADRIATGHTIDDQAETVLLNLLRGAGPAGLDGIAPVRGRVIRPLLGVTRAEVEKYCADNELEYRTDASNLDRRFLRNRVRHEVLPALRKVQPGVDEALRRLADIMREENAFVAEQAAGALREIGAQRPGEVGLACAPFANLHPALQRRVLRAAIGKLKGDELDIELERIEALVELVLSGRTGATVELPGGLRAERTYGEVVIAAAPVAAPELAEELTLPAPGEVTIPELGVKIEAARSRARKPPAGPMEALIDAGTIGLPLTVRTRRRGDRFTPFGMRGSVKLQDFFVNAKVPRGVRNRVPLVVSGEDIVWVVGYRIGNRHKVTRSTRRTMRLRASRLGER